MLNVVTMWILIIAVYPFQAQARFAKIDDASFVIDHAYIDLVVNADGSSLETNDLAIRIIKKQAIEFLGTYKLIFSPESEDLEIKSAYVENEGVKVDVDLKRLERKSVASKGQSLVDQMEVAIVFPQLKENSIINLKYTTKNKINNLSKVYSSYYSFGDQTVEYDSKIKITSPFKLFYALNDPDKKIKLSDSTDSKGVQTISLILTGPYINVLAEEKGVLSKKDITSITLSNTNDWNKISQEISAKVYEGLSTKLPDELQKVVNALPAQSTFDQTLQYLLNYIISNYRYTGDWRKFAGRVLPKKIELLVHDKYGDCKDFANLLIHLLNALKIKADYALVNRSFPAKLFSEKDLPALTYFNHMIVRAQAENEVFWVDPTNRLSVGKMVRADINKRLALNLNSQLPRLEMIGSKLSNEAKVVLNKEFQFSSKQDATISLTYKRSGEDSFILQDVLKDKTKQEIENALLGILSLGENKVVKEFKTNLDHSAYKDINLSSTYIANKIGTKASGTSIELELPIEIDVTSLFAINQKNEGAVDISIFPEISSTFTYKKIFLVGEVPLGCDIKKDWLSASRKVDLLKDGFSVIDSIKILKSELTRSEYQLESFGATLEQIRKCFLDNKVEYEYGIEGHRIVSQEFERSIATLSLKDRLARRLERAKEAIESVDKRKNSSLSISSAKSLLEKNIEEDPTYLLSYVYLARYINKSDDGDGQQALNVLNKALIYDPNFMDAKVGKAVVFYYMQNMIQLQSLMGEILRSDKGAMSFYSLSTLAQLFIGFKDIGHGMEFYNLAIAKGGDNLEMAHLNEVLGSYYSRLKDTKNCILYLKKAITQDNGHAWVHGSLSICYMGEKNYDDAIASAKAALDIMDFQNGRVTLAAAYAFKGIEANQKKHFDKAEKYLTDSLLYNPDSRIYAELIRAHMGQNKFDEAVHDAEKVIDLFQGDTKKAVELIAVVFENTNPRYSEFMQKALLNVKNDKRVGEVTYYIAYELGMQGKKEECKLWVNRGIKGVLKTLGAANKSEVDNIEDNVLLTNYHLLYLHQTNELDHLESANKRFNTAENLDNENAKVVFLKKYVQDANRVYGRSNSIAWKTKLYLNKNFNIPIPEWLSGN